jgi:hypothetical protein
VSDVKALYAFDAGRYAVRAWPDQGGVVYDEADATLYEVSPLACEVLTLLHGQPASTATDLVRSLIGEAPDEQEVLLMEDMLDQLVELGVLTSLSS